MPRTYSGGKRRSSSAKLRTSGAVVAAGAFATEAEAEAEITYLAVGRIVSRGIGGALGGGGGGVCGRKGSTRNQLSVKELRTCATRGSAHAD